MHRHRQGYCPCTAIDEGTIRASDVGRGGGYCPCTGIDDARTGIDNGGYYPYIHVDVWVLSMH